MNTDTGPTAFGRIFAPRVDWLARAPFEEVIDPDLAIVDTHHHLWNAPGRYLLDELYSDTSTGHNIQATVFVECRQGYRTTGPVELRPVGEVEFRLGSQVGHGPSQQDARGRRHRRLRRSDARRPC